METGFVYIWYDRKKKKYYIGSHIGLEDDGYICSSDWMRKAYRRRPTDFKRRILKREIEKSILREEEYKWLSLISSEELGKRYYNLRNELVGSWEKGRKREEDTKKKISQSLKGNVPWNKGKTGIYSEKTKEKIRNAMLGKCNHISELAKEKISRLSKGNQWAKGYKHTDEWKRNHSNQMKGKTSGMKNKMWITNGTDCRIISNGESIPHNWYRGRK